MAKHILIVENEGLIAGLLSRSLSRKGYDLTVLEPQDALKRVRVRKTSLVLLDGLATPAKTRKMCLSLRNLTPAPFLVLTERPLDLDIEAVKCLTKPLDTREFLVAVERTLSQRGKRSTRAARVIRRAGLVLDLRTRRLTRGEERYRLTPKEFALLRMLMRNPGKVLSHEAIMKEVWETDYTEDLRTLHVHVSWLRKKIEDVPKQPVRLRTVRGVGYRFSK
jgi:two-component system response regulator MprA